MNEPLKTLKHIIENYEKLGLTEEQRMDLNRIYEDFPKWKATALRLSCELSETS